MSCPDCSGLRALTCPSCLGSSACISRYCIEGWHHYKGGKKVRCPYCSAKGKIKCQACRGTLKAKCRICSNGKVERSCPVCTDGRLPCPDAGSVDALRKIWYKALRAACSAFTARTVGGMKDSWVTATDVASHTALVVLARAGTLGDKAVTFDYHAMPEVQAGLAWLDRYFDIRQQPKFSGGARVNSRSDSGYAAYLFSIQRLGMLLRIPVLGGERWHTTGARYLREIQLPDGSFEETSRSRLNGPVRCTTISLLFLLRVTVPVTGD